MSEFMNLSETAWKKAIDFFNDKLSYLIENKEDFGLTKEVVRNWDDHKNMARRNLHNTPEHYSRVLEVSKRGKVTQLSHKTIKNYEPPISSYIVIIEEIEGTGYQETKVYQKSLLSPNGIANNQPFTGLGLYSDQLSDKLVSFYEANAMAKSEEYIFVDVGKVWIRVEEEDLKVPGEIREELEHIGKMMFKEKQDYLLIMKIGKNED